jgi:hypothetical protein
LASFCPRSAPDGTGLREGWSDFFLLFMDRS